jgi:hypothetical protein
VIYTTCGGWTARQWVHSHDGETDVGGALAFLDCVGEGVGETQAEAEARGLGANCVL